MRGHILRYSVQGNSGTISGDDGKRYRFTGASWQATGMPEIGSYVDFDVQDEAATDILYVKDMPGNVAASTTVSGKKSRIVAALLALFLGSIGFHKFYLGHVGWGISYIILLVITFGIATAILGLIEGLIYLTKSDAEFERIYVQGRRPLF